MSQTFTLKLSLHIDAATSSHDELLPASSAPLLCCVVESEKFRKHPCFRTRLRVLLPNVLVRGLWRVWVFAPNVSVVL